MNQLDSVRAWLEKLCIKVPPDWIEACLEWIQEQHQNHPLRTDQLNNMVYEQWLMSDLQELGTSCLPQEVATATKLYLSGNYALQINSCVDVGTPYYGQLQKERGSENANSLVSGEQPNQPAWQPKPSRMLMLKLTDGILDVHGMEYQPIPHLKKVVPGTKILVQGRVLCRRGVLMLKSENIQVLGGEVDSLVEKNTVESVLQSALQDSSQHASKSERSEFSGRMLAADESLVKKENFSQSQKSSFVERVDRETHHPTTPVCKNSQPATSLSRQPHTNNITNGINSWKTERIDTAEGRSTNQVQLKSEERELGDDMTELFDDQDDFDMFVAGEPTTSSMTQQHTSHGQNVNKLARESGSFTAQVEKDNQRECIFTSTESSVRTGAAHSGSEVNKGHSVVTSDDLCAFDDDFDMEDLEMIEISESSADVSPVVSNTNCNKIKDEPCESVSTVPDRETVSDTVAENCLSNRNNFSVVKSEYPVRSETGNKACHFSAASSDGSFSKHVGVGRDPKQSAGSTSQCTAHSMLHRSRLGEDHSTLSLPKAVIRPLQQCQSQAAHTQGTMDRFLSSQSSFTGLRSTHTTDSEFTYLSKALKQPVAGKTFIIKGYVSTLMGRLTSQHGTQWRLSCKVNDGSAVAEVDLSNKVLTELIDFSAPDSLIMRQRAKTDPSVKDVLSEGLQQCQQRLVNLSCLMEIEFGADPLQLSVKQFIPVENKHILALYHRILQLTAEYTS